MTVETYMTLDGLVEFERSVFTSKARDYFPAPDGGYWAIWLLQIMLTEDGCAACHRAPREGEAPQTKSDRHGPSEWAGWSRPA